MKNQVPSFFLSFILLFPILFSPSNAQAASLIVDSLTDTITVDGACTLREAIRNANNNDQTSSDCASGSGADTITFSVSGTITLASALPAINDASELTIDGAGQSVTISGNNLVPVATIYSNSFLTLNNLTIVNGRTGIYGGGLENYGTLTITNCVFSNNSNSSYDGGAIYNQSASLTITNSTFTGNTAANGNHGGGGVYSLAGSVSLNNSTFSNNSAANGGGIYCYDCTLNVTGSTFSGNHTPNGSGGGIHNYSGSVTITDSVFSGNGASWGDGGGGIYNEYGSLTIVNSIFSDNSATGSPGGAIFNDSLMNISKSTFTQNNAASGGGVFTDSKNSTIANCTFSGNGASASNGGGVLNTDELIITNSTLSDNSAHDRGGGLANTGGSLTLRNTIVANNTGDNCSGTITNGGNNLEDGVTCGWGSEMASWSNTDPLLSSLTGSPAYFLLNAGSLAIDGGNDSICAAWPVNNQSQNGVVRPVGVHCDIGSYEYVDTIPPVVQGITRLDPNPTGATSVHFLINLSEAVTGLDTSDFNLAVTGLTGVSITALSGGPSAYIVTVNTGSGAGTIRLDVVDNDSIVDLALNPLGGTGIDNGSYFDGETYTIDLYRFCYLPFISKD